MMENRMETLFYNLMDVIKANKSAQYDSIFEFKDHERASNEWVDLHFIERSSRFTLTQASVSHD
jgi:hypothetical protein